MIEYQSMVNSDVDRWKTVFNSIAENVFQKLLVKLTLWKPVAVL